MRRGDLETGRAAAPRGGDNEPGGLGDLETGRAAAPREFSKSQSPKVSKSQSLMVSWSHGLMVSWFDSLAPHARLTLTGFASLSLTRTSPPCSAQSLKVSKSPVPKSHQLSFQVWLRLSPQRCLDLRPFVGIPASIRVEKNAPPACPPSASSRLKMDG